MTDERLTVPALVRAWSTQSPSTRFVVTDDTAITFRELDDLSGRLIERLIGVGVAKRRRVGVLMPNGIDWAVLAVALVRMGAVVVPLSTLLRPPELEAQLRTAGVEQLVIARAFRDRDYVADLRAIAPEIGPGAEPLSTPVLPRLRSVLVWDEWAPGGAVALADAPAPVHVDAFERAVRPADDLGIVFTSGSRGAPKGVIHTHGGALGATAAGLDARRLEAGDRLYIPMPFFWMGGFGTGLLSALVAGATLITESEPDPARTLRLLERERVTLFRGWPDQAARLAAHTDFANTDLSSLKRGSLEAVLPPDQRGRPGSRPVVFGMTESFGPYCGGRLDRDLPEDKWGSIGRPFPGVEVRIVDVDTGAPVSAGVRGEIQLRGRNIMRGICGRERAAVFTGDGYYATGDLAHLDRDGYLYFAGRRDDMFKVRGASVYPSEVEHALASIPFVRHVHVVDVYLDGASNAVVGAAVVVDDPDNRSVVELDRAARERLSAFKVPTRWAMVAPDEVPTTATGKIDKQRLMHLLASRGTTT